MGVTLLFKELLSFLFHEDEALWPRAKATFFRLLRLLPPVRAKIEEGVGKAMRASEKQLLTAKPGEKYRLQLPARGLTHGEVIGEVAALEKLAEIDWRKGWVSGALYNCSPEITAVATEVYSRFAWTNPLHMDVFPYIRKMEAEVVEWCVRIFNGGKDACGAMTTGGTESILMAMRAYRQIGYDRGIKYPEIVCAVSVHCAFNKAAEYFRMKITQVPVDPNTRKINLRAVAAAISKNTVVLVASAPHFPHGIVDPIEDMARLARGRGIGLHVDCCLGGFIVPFMERAGYEMAPFDFRVDGVTSISADTHKYGYAPKGTSVVLYANKDLRRKQYFIAPSWQGGLYATATMPGSRAGGLIAATWATMLFMGEDGYVDATRKVVETTRKITAAIKPIPGVYLLGDPKVSVFAFASDDFDIYRMGPAMSARGWNLSLLQFPKAIHLTVTMLHTHEGVADRFVTDLRECTAEIMKDPKAEATGEAALYGVATTLPDRSIVADIAGGFIDLMYQARAAAPE